MNGFLRGWKGWRTVLINAVTFFLTGMIWIGPDIISVLLSTDIEPLLPDGWAPACVLGLSVLNIVLRKLTTTPLGQKE